MGDFGKLLEWKSDMQKRAGWLGTTDTDEDEAVAAGAAPAAATGVGALGAAGALKYRDLRDRKYAPDFGTIEELVHKVNQMDGFDLPPTLRLMQSTPLNDPLALGYAAMPNLGSILTGTEETLYMPWTRKNLWGGLSSTLLGEMLPFGDAVMPGEQIVLDQARKEMREAGGVGAALRQARAAMRDESVRALRDRTNYSPSAILHELGHLSNSERGKIRVLQGAGILAPLLGAGLGTAAALSDNEYANYAAPAIALAPSLPTLIEEARATSGARKMMQNLVDQGLDGANMKRLYKALGPAYGTYALGALAPVLAAGVTAKVMRDKRDRGFLGDVWAKTKDMALSAKDALTPPGYEDE